MVATLLWSCGGGGASGTGGGTDCTENSDCEAGFICESGICYRVCGSDSDCASSQSCQNSRCLDGARDTIPQIVEVQGNGSTTGNFADGLAIHGAYFTGADVTLNGPVSGRLDVRILVDDRIDVALPLDLVAGTYSLTVANGAGSDQTEVQLLRGEQGEPQDGPGVLALLLPEDGTGSSLDADLLDGLDSSNFLSATAPISVGALEVTADEASVSLAGNSNGFAVAQAGNDGELLIGNGTQAATQFLPTLVGTEDSDAIGRGAVALVGVGDNDEAGRPAAVVIDGRNPSEPLSNRNILEVKSYAEPRMVVTANGSLGLGTTAPTGRLHVGVGYTYELVGLDLQSGELAAEVPCGCDDGSDAVNCDTTGTIGEKITSDWYASVYCFDVVSGAFNEWRITTDPAPSTGLLVDNAGDTTIGGSVTAANLAGGIHSLGTVTINAGAVAGPYTVPYGKTMPCDSPLVFFSFRNNQHDGFVTTQIDYNLTNATEFGYVVLNPRAAAQVLTTWSVQWFAFCP